MKNTFQDIYRRLGSCSHIPDQYYGAILTLAGMVYDNKVDKNIEQELKSLSIAYDKINNSTLGIIKEIVHDIVFWAGREQNNKFPDIEHLLREYRDAPTKEVNTFISNLIQLYAVNNEQNNQTRENVKITADFTSLINKLQHLIEKIEPTEVNEFNIPKIIGFITTRAIEKGFITESEMNENQ